MVKVMKRRGREMTRRSQRRESSARVKKLAEEISQDE